MNQDKPRISPLTHKVFLFGAILGPTGLLVSLRYTSLGYSMVVASAIIGWAIFFKLRKARKTAQKEASSNPPPTGIRSGTFCRCEWCKTEDYCYGQPTSAGVTAPFCNHCGSQYIMPVEKENT